MTVFVNGEAWLPLREGANEVVLAVTDDQLFGWGASMSIGSM